MQKSWAARLTKKQKERIKSRFLALRNILQSYLPERNEKGMIIAYAESAKLPFEKPELGVKKDWKRLLEAFEKGEGRYAHLTFPDDYICQAVDYKCDYLKGSPKFKGEGNLCPEHKANWNFCCIGTGSRINDVSQPPHIYRRACVTRRCMKRIVGYIIERGVTAPYVKDVTRYCKYTCHRYQECISPQIPDFILERIPNSPFRTYDPEYAKVPYKTLYDQYEFCVKVANEITLEGIKVCDEIIEACST
jgi:hypothetical protein